MSLPHAFHEAIACLTRRRSFASLPPGLQTAVQFKASVRYYSTFRKGRQGEAVPCMDVRIQRCPEDPMKAELVCRSEDGGQYILAASYDLARAVDTVIQMRAHWLPSFYEQLGTSWSRSRNTKALMRRLKARVREETAAARGILQRVTGALKRGVAAIGLVSLEEEEPLWEDIYGEEEPLWEEGQPLSSSEPSSFSFSYDGEDESVLAALDTELDALLAAEDEEEAEGEGEAESESESEGEEEETSESRLLSLDF